MGARSRSSVKNKIPFPFTQIRSAIPVIFHFKADIHPIEYALAENTLA
jgi:hypothetical protein